MLFGPFLCRHDYDVNFPDALFYGKRKNKTTKAFFLFLNLNVVLIIQFQENSATSEN